MKLDKVKEDQERRVRALEEQVSRLHFLTFSVSSLFFTFVIWITIKQSLIKFRNVIFVVVHVSLKPMLHSLIKPFNLLMDFSVLK
jgi:hypothetical protein